MLDMKRWISSLLRFEAQVNSFKKFTDKTRNKKLNTASLKNFRREKDTLKEGKIQDILKSGDHILAQVSKELISSKGPRLSTELSLCRKIYGSYSIFR